ncbi:acyl-CoA dehydrogenase family protein [Haloprofundus sp. MHR1]|uniref:acyl-CoA dehydrogenase family protein n=1 Tax=Haloprofundus sp. MHR1 TaxID=2572921 RepID=UPI0010BE3D3E|nr:acyl-CoA dehydrogenase family protein [Haloprofundus sp. MHR1]QCJ46500.1 acyl-CoA dehydrogenase [Haloprofundus sp. MHR1]
MRFTLTNEQRALRDDAREFVETSIVPRAADLDRDGAYPASILDELGERGYAGLTVSESYGGRGEGMVELALVTEELSAGLMAVASAVALHLGVAEIVERFGTDAQKDRLLPDMASYDRVGALGLSEENAGSDKRGIETTATREGDEWVLDGHKRWVTNYDDADVVLTYARTGPPEDAPRNVTAFLVPADEFEVDTVWETLGARSVKSPKVTLSNVRVADDRRIGDADEALVERGSATTGVNVPARAVGLARAALEDTVAYTSGREQFGGRIGDYQGVRWRVAEMARRVDTARLLTLRAADYADRGRDATREFGMAKVYATEAAVDVTNDALQLHGGVGYTTDRSVERYLRDARLLTIAGGPNEGHRDTVADAVYERET